MHTIHRHPGVRVSRRLAFPPALVAAALVLMAATESVAHAQRPPVQRPPTGGPPAGRAVAPPAAKPAALARIVGSVFDSVAMKALPGALVQFVVLNDPSKVRSTTSDAYGNFRFDSVAVGSYVLGFFHARMDSIIVDLPLVRVDVTDSSEITVGLGIPSAPSIVGATCGPAALRDSTGLFAGSIRSATGDPLAGPGKLRVQWTEFYFGSRGIERRTPSTLANATATGEFAVCGIPTGSLVLTRAFAGTDSSGFAEFEMPQSGYLHRTMFVGRAQRVVSTDTARPSLTLIRGPGTLRGVVRNPRDEPIQGARVSVWSTGIQGTTDARGQFSLSALPNGTYTIEVRALGFEATRRAVDILPGSPEPTIVALAPTARLDTFRVNATRASAADAAFEARRKRGFGTFIDAAAIERRQAISMADLLRTTPGVSVSPGNFGDQVFMRGSGMSQFCAPTIFLNGARTSSDDATLDAIVSPQEVRAIEVYSRAANLPAEFQTMNGCGAIVVWTGARR